jgi:hypothetical protein
VGCSYIWCWPFFWNDGCCFSFIDWGIFKHFKMAIISDAFPLSFENLSKHSSVNVFTILTVNWSIQSCIASSKCNTTTCSRPDGTVSLKLSTMSALLILRFMHTFGFMQVRFSFMASYILHCWILDFHFWFIVWIMLTVTTQLAHDLHESTFLFILRNKQIKF